MDHAGFQMTDEQYPLPPRVVALLAAVVVSVGVGMAAGDERVVYENDFNAKPGTSFPEWSSSPVRYASKHRPPGEGTREVPAVTNVESPKGGRRFLGEFGGPRIDPTARTAVRQEVRLTLDKLPRHEEVTVSFDLLVLKSWDGSSPRYGPDRWRLAVVDGPTLLDTTFSNNPKLDADGSYQDYPRPRSQPRTWAVATNSLGYDFFGDSVYHFTFTFPHAGDGLVLEFASDLFEGKGTGDESWGLDDVRVSVNPKASAKPARKPVRR
jgi:hypothetical protein